jgi:hypothetical protein
MQYQTTKEALTVLLKTPKFCYGLSMRYHALRRTLLTGHHITMPKREEPKERLPLEEMLAVLRQTPKFNYRLSMRYHAMLKDDFGHAATPEAIAEKRRIIEPEMTTTDILNATPEKVAAIKAATRP